MTDDSHRQFHWLRFVGLEETARYFNAYGHLLRICGVNEDD